MGKTLLELQACVHRNIWTRFMSPDYILYDYAGLNGEVCLPTPEECEDNKPNALGWWSPIEDGAFFTGDYLLAQCARYDHCQTAEGRDEVRKLVAGLCRLQDAGRAPGMIPRGLGSDGSCHYPASSNDQNIPWMLGLWRYLATDIPTVSEREDCRARLVRHIEALQAANWSIPGERPGFERGSMLHEDGLEGCLSSVHIAITTKIYAELTGDGDERVHRALMDSRLSNGKTRREIIGEGFSTVDWKTGYCWFTSHSQYAVRELYRKEKNPEFKLLYRHALQTLGKTAADGILRYREFQHGKPRAFTPDWRIMLSAWEPQTSSDEAAKVSAPEHALWSKACPAVHEDKSTLLHAIPAAWIVMLSEDPSLIREWLPEIINAIGWFDYDQVHYGALFFVENVIQEILESPMQSRGGGRTRP
jgi:hypothetical protein